MLEYTPQHIEAVYAIEKRVFKEQAWTYESFFCFDIMRGYVLEERGRVIGFCLFLLAINEVEITNFAIDEEYQGKGYGSFLLSQMMNALKEKGYTHFYLDVRESNTPAIGLYQKNGFVALGKRKDYYSQPMEDALLMGAIISEDDV